jgi:hypothetical protein
VYLLELSADVFTMALGGVRNVVVVDGEPLQRQLAIQNLVLKKGESGFVQNRRNLAFLLHYVTHMVN